MCNSLPYRREPESRHTKHSAWRQAPDILCQRARQRSSVHPRFGDDATGQACTHLAINDINSELDDKEIDSWIRLTRVLTHEIMNSVTPITSLSDTLLSLHQNADDEIRNGLEVISTTGKSLISFVESYRKFTHIPTPEPTLFYVQKFAERMVKLARHHTDFPNITINVSVEPSDLIVYADENLISQVVLNLLKNAMQAIGCGQADGLIEVKAYCNEEEAVLIEVSNNGPIIPQEEAEHIFVPFFTTKEGGAVSGFPPPADQAAFREVASL